MLVPLGKEKVILYSEIVGVVTNLILNAILIPDIGASGAAIGTVITELVVLLVQMCALRGNLDGVLSMKSVIKMLSGILCAVGITRFIGMEAFSAFWKLVVTSICYFGVYALIILSPKKTVEYIAKFARKLKGKR